MTAVLPPFAFEVFQHPQFQRFTAAFDALLKSEIASLGLHPWAAQDEIIAALAAKHQQKLAQLLHMAASRTVGVPAPFDRIGDAVTSFRSFVLNHHRTPKARMQFNDVLYHVKTSDDMLDPLRAFVSDKEFVKVFIAGTVGNDHNVPTLAVLRSVEELDTFDFPRTCYIKPTHESGKTIIRSDGEPVDLGEMRRWFGTNRYAATREANYARLRPKIIVEPPVFGQTDAWDYKIFCYRGQPKLIFVDVDRAGNHRRKFFDTEWREQPYSITYPKYGGELEAPRCLGELLRIAAALSRQFSFIRIDFYVSGDEILVGEITNCHGNACRRFLPPSAESEASRIIFGTDT